MLPRAAHGEVPAVAVPPPLRDGNLPLPPQERARDGARLRQDGLQRAVGDDLAAVLPGPGPDVDHPVRGPDRLLVVLHDEDGVAEVPQPRQRGDQLRVVPLVQPDRRLVQDVEHAHERRADLGRQPDPLRLAAGEADAGPVQRQVVEPHVHEEAEAGDDLLEHLAGDRPLALGHPVREVRRPVERLGHGQPRHLGDVAPVHRDGEHLRPEAAAAAGGARLLDHELLELGPDVLRLRLPETPLEVRDDALERGDVAVLAPLVAVPDDDLLVLGGEEQELDRLGRQVRAPARRSASRATANTASVIFIRHEISVGILFHGARAPALMLRLLSGITSPGR